MTDRPLTALWSLKTRRSTAANNSYHTLTDLLASFLNVSQTLRNTGLYYKSSGVAEMAAQCCTSRIVAFEEMPVFNAISLSNH